MRSGSMTDIFRTLPGSFYTKSNTYFKGCSMTYQVAIPGNQIQEFCPTIEESAMKYLLFIYFVFHLLIISCQCTMPIRM